MSKKPKKKKHIIEERIAPVIIGAILVFCCMIPVLANLLGRTGYITEITRVERIGGRLDESGRPNAYWWTVAYKFRMENGEIENGSVQVKGDAISSKSGLKVGSPIRYLALYTVYNAPGEGELDGSTIMFLLLAGFGVFMIRLGVRKEKPSKTPAQRSREYQAKKKVAKGNQTKAKSKTKESTPVYSSGGNKMYCENCGTQLDADAKFCESCGKSQQVSQKPSQLEPDWDSLTYDDETDLTEAEVDELYGIATDEEIEEEFDLINSEDEGPEYYRKVLAIVRWRRDNGQ